jgi:predicted RNA-binding protein with PUA-like domain
MAKWLVKSESTCYSIDDLKRDKRTLWTGVRNYQARNYLQAMKKGELVLYYHSVDNPIGIVGIGQISKEAQPDPTQFEKGGEYFDPKASREKPRWFCPEIEFVEKFRKLISREELFARRELADMVLLQRMSRLSVQPVSDQEFRSIRALASSL